MPLSSSAAINGQNAVCISVTEQICTWTDLYWNLRLMFSLLNLWWKDPFSFLTHVSWNCYSILLIIVEFFCLEILRLIKDFSYTWPATGIYCFVEYPLLVFASYMGLL